MKRTDQNALLWEQEGDRNDLRPLSRPQKKKLFLFLLALLLCAMFLVVLLAVPNGMDDVSFEYEAVLKSVNFDAEGHVTSLLTTPLDLSCDELLVVVERGSRAITPTGKTSYRKLAPGTLLFLSVADGAAIEPGTPPSIMADVVMVKQVD